MRRPARYWKTQLRVSIPTKIPPPVEFLAPRGIAGPRSGCSSASFIPRTAPCAAPASSRPAFVYEPWAHFWPAEPVSPRSTSPGRSAGPASHRQRRLTEISRGRSSSPAGATVAKLQSSYSATWWSVITCDSSSAGGTAGARLALGRPAPFPCPRGLRHKAASALG
jgi:hypothetical protein